MCLPRRRMSKNPSRRGAAFRFLISQLHRTLLSRTDSVQESATDVDAAAAESRESLKDAIVGPHSVVECPLAVEESAPVRASQRALLLEDAALVAESTADTAPVERATDQLFRVSFSASSPLAIGRQ